MRGEGWREWEGWPRVGAVIVRPGIKIPAGELRWRFSRSSGPGGQSVNTADSRVSLSFDLAATKAIPPNLKTRALERLQSRLVAGVLTINSEQERSQLRNRQVAARQLVELLRAAIAAPPTPRRPTRPSHAARERRISAKKRRGETKRLREANPRDD